MKHWIFFNEDFVLIASGTEIFWRVSLKFKLFLATSSFHWHLSIRGYGWVELFNEVLDHNSVICYIYICRRRCGTCVDVEHVFEHHAELAIGSFDDLFQLSISKTILFVFVIFLSSPKK